MKKMIEIELYQHPFEPYVPENAKKLILGTMPPHRFCAQPQEIGNDDVNFYYGSKDNGFWDILGDITNNIFDQKNNGDSIQQRKDFLNNYNLAIADIIYQFTRCGQSALDTSLCVYKLRSITDVLEKNQNIELILFTSGEVEKYFKKQFNSHKIYFTPDKYNKKQSTFTMNSKTYITHRLYSPSSMTNITGIKKVDKVEEYRQFVLGNIDH